MYSLSKAQERLQGFERRAFLWESVLTAGRPLKRAFCLSGGTETLFCNRIFCYVENGVLINIEGGETCAPK